MDIKIYAYMIYLVLGKNQLFQWVDRYPDPVAKLKLLSDSENAPEDTFG
jgi:hypothetical protein